MSKYKAWLRALAIVFAIIGASAITEKEIAVLGITFLVISVYLLFIAEL
jgi:hypothetical protein